MAERKRSGCFSLLITWLVSGLAVMATAHLLPGVTVDGFGAALWAAVAIGFANALVRPVMIVLTLPVTILTLGLFLLVINGLMLELADYLIDGFKVDGLLWGIVGSVVFSIVSSILGAVMIPTVDDDD